RFAELSRKADPPFLGASVGRGPFVSSAKEEAALTARVKEDGVERGLQAALAEVERVARFGFTSTELDRQKLNLQRSLDRMLAEKDNRESGSRADEYIRNFLQNEPVPGEQLEYTLNQRFLPQITLNEINARARDWFSEKNRIVVVTAPDKPGVVVPD